MKKYELKNKTLNEADFLPKISANLRNIAMAFAKQKKPVDVKANVAKQAPIFG